MAVTGYDNYSYRWRTGFVNAAQLTATYEIAQFPTFADMGGHEWFNPEGTSWFDEGAQAELTLGGDANFLGLQTVTWTLKALTPEMLNYVLYNAAYFNGAASMDSTLSSWNGTRNRWEIVWAKTSRDIISAFGEPNFRRGSQTLVINHIVQQDAP
jgi:hypothetical protein